jgi:hypothetical protein
MARVIGIIAAALPSIAPLPPALGQTECAVVCARDVRFPDCSGTAIKHADGRIGITGKVLDIGTGAYCKTRLSIEILQASMGGTPSRIEIDFDPCLKSTVHEGDTITVHEGDTINVYVWQRPGPNTGAYTLARCPK